MSGPREDSGGRDHPAPARAYLDVVEKVRGSGGGGGIRTPGRVAPTAVFKNAAFDHSATPPRLLGTPHSPIAVSFARGSSAPTRQFWNGRCTARTTAPPCVAT